MSRLLFSIGRNVITDSVSKRSRRSTLFFEIPIYWDLGDPGYLSVTKDQFLDLFISLSILTNDQKKLIACFSTQSAVDWPLVKYCWSLLWAGLRWTPPCNSVRKRGGLNVENVQHLARVGGWDGCYDEHDQCRQSDKETKHCSPEKSEVTMFVRA